jgi:hypothetical protein
MRQAEDRREQGTTGAAQRVRRWSEPSSMFGSNLELCRAIVMRKDPAKSIAQTAYRGFVHL